LEDKKKLKYFADFAHTDNYIPFPNIQIYKKCYKHENSVVIARMVVSFIQKPFNPHIARYILRHEITNVS